MEAGSGRGAHTLLGAGSQEDQEDSYYNEYPLRAKEEARLPAEWSDWRGELLPAIHRDANFLGCQAASL